MRMGIGLGIGINRSNYAQGIFSAYQSRVTADGGVTEAGACVDAVSGLLQSASLLLIPSGYKSGKAYAEIPTNGNGDLTWTRASDAWRTNADGLIQRVPWNLLTYSNTFSNAAWVKYGVGTGTAASVTSGFTDPNGGSNAWRLQCNLNGGTTTSDRSYIYQSGISGTPFSAAKSIWIKNNTANAVTIFVGVNGSLDSVTIAANADWQRIKIEGGTINNEFRIGTMGGASLSNTVDILIYGAQLVEGSSAQTYLPTTDRLNVPRLSYMYGSCPALLLEPQRTNLCLWSQNFDDANWGKTTASVTANQATAPDGTNTMDLLVFSATAGRLTQGVATTNGATYTFSVWLATQSGTQTVEIGNINLGVWQTVTVTTTPTRFSVTQVASSTSRFPGIQSTGAYSILAWGGQCELGAYPTTYIPTTTASATRIADSFSRSNIYTNGLITSSGGTWFVELITPHKFRDSTNLLRIGDSNNGINVNGGTATYGFVISKAVGGTASNILFSTLTTTAKIAIKWNGTSADVFVNGTKQVSATSFTPTIMEDLTGTGGSQFFIQAMGLHPTPLTDAQCIELTTL